MPINVTVMQDGAEVFKSSLMNYSNNGCTEQIKNADEAYRDDGRTSTRFWVQPVEVKITSMSMKI